MNCFQGIKYKLKAFQAISVYLLWKQYKLSSHAKMMRMKVLCTFVSQLADSCQIRNC